MSGEKKVLILIILIILFFLIFQLYTGLYIRYVLKYDYNDIRNKCLNPQSYSCEDLFKIKDYCNYNPYYNKLTECDIKNGYGN